MTTQDKLADLLAKQVAIASELRGIKSAYLADCDDHRFDLAEIAEDAADDAAEKIRTFLRVEVELA